jgi:hypothetical protein
MAKDTTPKEPRDFGTFIIAYACSLLLFVPVTASMILWLFFILGWREMGFDKTLVEVLLSKAHVIVGLPAAAITAFIVVFFLRQTSGPIEFQGAGFKFKGTSGQVVLWLVCFIGIAGMIKLLW